PLDGTNLGEPGLCRGRLLVSQGDVEEGRAAGQVFRQEASQVAPAGFGSRAVAQALPGVGEFAQPASTFFDGISGPVSKTGEPGAIPRGSAGGPEPALSKTHLDAIVRLGEDGIGLVELILPGRQVRERAHDRRVRRMVNPGFFEDGPGSGEVA